MRAIRMHGWHDAAGVVALAGLIGILWATPILPLQDYPEWIVQGRIARCAWWGDTSYANSYEVNSGIVPPNLFGTIVLGMLGSFLAPDAAGKTLLTVYTLLFVLGWFVIATRRREDDPLRWFGLLMVWNHFFFLGFLNFIIGTAMLLGAAAALQRIRESRGIVWFSTAAVASVLLYICHVVPLLIFLALVLLEWFRYRRKRRDTSVWIVPTAGAILIAALVTTHASEWLTQLHWADSITADLSAVRYALFPMQRLVPFEYPVPLSLVNGVCVSVLFASVVGCVWGFWKRWRSEPSAAWAGLACLALSVLLPIRSVGDFYVIVPRMFVIGAMLILCFVEMPAVHRWFQGFVAGCAVLLVIAYAIQFHFYQSDARKILTETREAAVSSRSLVAARGYAEEFDKRWWAVLSGAVRPLLHAERYFDLEHAATQTPTFETGIVQNKTAIVTSHRARLRTILTTQGRDEAIQSARQLAENWSPAVDDLIVLGNHDTQERFRDLLAKWYGAERSGEYFMILHNINQ